MSRRPAHSMGLVSLPHVGAQEVTVNGHLATRISNGNPTDKTETGTRNNTSRLPLRQRAKRWFASLDIAERSRLLTFEDPAWCLLAANMAARLERRAYAGQGVRFDVQRPPAGGIGGGR